MVTALGVVALVAALIGTGYNIVHPSKQDNTEEVQK